MTNSTMTIGTTQRAEGPFRLTGSMHTYLLATQLWRHNHGPGASAVIDKVAAGGFLVSTGASDWVSSSGSTRQVGGGFVVGGHQQWLPVSPSRSGQVKSPAKPAGAPKSPSRFN